MDLFVRAARSDNLVIDELLAPATAGVPFGGREVPMRGLIVDAPTAHSQTALRQAAEGSGLPLIVDPLTHLFQDEQPADRGWATLDFADARAFPAEHFFDGTTLDRLVRGSISFQLHHGATILVPPYFHAKSPDDPWFRVQLAANRRSAEYLRAEGINLQVAPILVGSLRTFGARKHWDRGADEFLRSVAALNVRYVPVALSSSRPSNGDTEDRIGAYLATVRHLSAMAPVIAWRQGQYGLAAVAAGAVGYQTGMAVDERCDFAQHARVRRPQPPERKKEPKMLRHVYLSRFGRSVSGRVAEVLIDSGHLRGTLTCTDPVCCPNGASSMKSAWRQHAVRSRARELSELNKMPNAGWRLNHVARMAERAADAARTANEVLAETDVKDRLPERSFRSLATVADAIRAHGDRRAG